MIYWGITIGLPFEFWWSRIMLSDKIFNVSWYYKPIVVWESDTNIYITQFTCSHGNKCAGVIAGERGNDLCGTGVAYEANIAGNNITRIH